MSGGKQEDVNDRLLTTVKRGPLRLEIVDAGRVEAKEQIEIKSRVPGQVHRVVVEEGDSVEPGALLIEVDKTDFRRELARAEAELLQAQQAREFAELQKARKQQALENQAISRFDVDIAHNDVLMRRATERIAAVAVAAARDRLNNCDIKAPIRGTVTHRGIEAGEVVTPGVQATFEGKPLLTVADLSQLVVKVELNQIDVARTMVGQKVEVVVDALPGRTFTADVSRVAPASTKAAGRDAEVFVVEATLQSESPTALREAGLKPGMTADVAIVTGALNDVLLLPVEAVIQEDKTSFVKILRTDGAKRRWTRWR